MRACILMIGLCAALAATAATAHGPQLQITNDGGKITTRQLFQDSPYLPVSPPKSVYVIPLLEFDGAWLSRPSNALLAGIPEFPSGPGFSYGSDQADGGERAFEAGSILSVEFVDGLKLWNGSSFADAGATQLKGYRGSDPAIVSPAANFAVTSDTAPFDSLSLAAVAATYDIDAHAGLRWALLGDGSSPTSVSPDGVYLLSMKLSSNQSNLAPSDPYYFVLHKNASTAAVAAAVASLPVAPELVQIVPEPGTVLLAVAAACGFALVRQTSRK